MIPVLIARLRELADSLPRPGCEWEERPTFAPPTTPDQLAGLEATAGFPMPPDLRDFFALTDRVVGMSIHNGYQIGGAETMTATVTTGSSPNVVAGVPAVPVGWDGGGNVFLLSRVGGVWMWNHETRVVTAVTESFTAFLERVVADWSAYINDTQGWGYLV